MYINIKNNLEVFHKGKLLGFGQPYSAALLRAQDILTSPQQLREREAFQLFCSFPHHLNQGLLT